MDASKKLQVSKAVKMFLGLVQCLPPSNDFTIWICPAAAVVALNPNWYVNTYTTPFESVRTVHPERPNPLGDPERDRGYYSAPSISPDGNDVYVVYNAFDSPFRDSAEGPGNDRQLVGVVLHANWPPATAGSFTENHRGVTGDARGSSQNDLAAEFLGDYVYSAATNDYSMSVWNDVRDAADCPAIDHYRQLLHNEAEETGQPTAEPEEPRGAEDRRPNAKPEPEETGPEAPDVQEECEPNFGNSDIFGVSIADPTAP